MMTKRSRTLLSQVLLLSAVAFLPGCKFPFGGCGDQHKCCPSETHELQGEELKIEGIEPELLKETVVSLEGKPVRTGADFEKNFLMIMEAQPAIKDMLPYIPQEQQDQIFGQMLENMAMEQLMLRWVKDSGLENTPEFRKNAQRVHEAVDRDLALRAFENELLKEVVIADAEAEKFYQEQKTTEPAFQRPPFQTSAAGVKAEGVEIGTEKEAQEFAEKAKKGSLAQVAEAAKKTVTDYGTVTPQSFIDAKIKKAILAAKSFPATEVVQGDDAKYYVVHIESKQEPKYAEFEQAKDAVKQVITGKKLNELYTKRVGELKEKYKMEINKEYINKRKKKEAAPVTQEMAAPEVEIPAEAMPTEPSETKPQAA